MNSRLHSTEKVVDSSNLTYHILDLCLKGSKWIDEMTERNGSTWLPVDIDRTVEERCREMFIGLWPSVLFTAVEVAVGVPGNLLVFFVYLKPLGASSTRVFILAMAVCDLLCNIVSMPLIIFHLRYFFNSVDNPTCKFMQFSWRFPTFVSVGLLVCVAIDRHRRICFPFKTQMRERQAMMIMLVTLVLVFLLILPFVFIYGQNRRKYNGAVACDIEEEDVQSPWRTLTTILLTLFFLTALTTLAGCYIHITCKVRELKRNRQRTDISQKDEDNRDQQPRIDNPCSDSREKQSACESQSDANKCDSNISTDMREWSRCASLQMLDAIEETVTSEYLPPLEVSSVSPVSWAVGSTVVELQASNNLKVESTSGDKKTLRETKNNKENYKTRRSPKKHGWQKQTKFSKTTLMMLVLTLTTIVNFLPSIIIE